MRTSAAEHKVLGKSVGFVDNNIDRPIFEMTKNIKVKLIDWSPVIKNIKKFDKIFKELDLEIRAGKGIIFVGDGKIPVLIDSECCGIDSELINLMIGGKLKTIKFIRGIAVFEKKKGFIAMMPNFFIDVNYGDIEKCFTGEEKELWEFMGSRYLYNPRIEKNMVELVKFYKGIKNNDDCD